MDDIEDLNLVSAEELRETTPAAEDIYNAKLQSFNQNLMSSCVSANSRRIFNYTTTVVDQGFGDKETTQRILNDMKATFEKLGYKVELKYISSNTENLVTEHTLIKIDWSPSETTY